MVSELLDATETPLGSPGVYTSGVFSLNNPNRSYEVLTGTVVTDQAGLLEVQQSGNGSNWDHTESITLSAGTTAAFSYEVVGKWGRLRVTNTSGSAQSYLRSYLFGRDR